MSNPTAPASSSLLKSAQRGIISRSFEHIFEAIGVAEDSRFLALVSYLEIYNENIRDLLSNNRGNLPLKETSEGGIVVQNLSQHPVHNVEDCERLLELGNNSRAVGGTNMNATSSRSHSIFSICVEQVAKEAVDTQADDLALLQFSPGIKRGKLNLVDLAGSERQGKTGATGDRLKEATKINLSLSALGNVISALVDGKMKHIPYRDSKLTRLLQDSLGGNTKTLMIACISPAESNYDETLSTLRYANRAKNISNKPVLNEDPTETIIRQYREEILKLKEMLSGSGGGGGGSSGGMEGSGCERGGSGLGTPAEVIVGDFNAERERLQDEMQRLAEDQRKEKERLTKEMEALRVYYEERLNRDSEEVRVVSKDKEKVDDEKENCDWEEKQEQEETKKIKNEDQMRMNKAEIQQKIREMQGILIGGERASDVQLMEKRKQKRLELDHRQRWENY